MQKAPIKLHGLEGGFHVTLQRNYIDRAVGGSAHINFYAAKQIDSIK